MTVLGIVGAGGHGREAHAVAIATGRYDRVVFADDASADPERFGRIGDPMLVPIEDLGAHADQYVVAIGDPAVRRAVVARIDTSLRATTLIADGVTVGADVAFADGVMIYPGAVVTTNVRIGAHGHVNCGAVVSHDCRIGSFVSVSPGVLLNGEVTIEDDVFLGSGAIVLPGRTVGQGAVVGAGAVVTEDVAPGATVVGVPAR